jgi:AcrR family transcriptional regulator
LSATLELLAERGLDAMSIEEVAARAGVGKTTIYRRWPSKGLLALDAFVISFREEQPLPDTGTLRGDLLSALHAWVRAVTQTAMGPMLTGLIAEAQHDPELRGAWRDRVLEPLRAQHRIMLDRAIDRGEIAASVDRDVVLDLFFGAAEHRLLLGHRPMTGEFIAEVVDVILGGIAGAKLCDYGWGRCRSGNLRRSCNHFRLAGEGCSHDQEGFGTATRTKVFVIMGAGLRLLFLRARRGPGGRPR